jgi:hypothetical protein
MATTISGTVLMPALDGTLINLDNCVISVCSLDYAQIAYVPSYGGNLAYCATFGVLLLAQMGLVWKYHVWGFFVGMICGLILEVLGYVGRINLSGDPFNFDQFVLYLVCLTIGAAFLTASVYLCLGRIVIVYGQSIPRFSPKFYTSTFIFCDLVSLVLEALGGALAAIQAAGDWSRTGIDVMVDGLAFQVVSLTIFIILDMEFVYRARKARACNLNFDFLDLRRRAMFRILPHAIAVATITIYIRCILRVAELKNVFGGALANDQTAFMILEGLMIISATIALTVCHPGIAFGSVSSWAAANWTWKKGNKENRDHERVVSQNGATHTIEGNSIVDIKT